MNYNVGYYESMIARIKIMHNENLGNLQKEKETNTYVCQYTYNEV